MESKNILIAGGTGFLGRELETFFVNNKNCEVKILTRNPKKENHIYWDGSHPGEWVMEIEWADVVINLSGKSVDCRYNEANKREILDSRLNSTYALSKAIEKAENSPQLWLNSSSATIYVHSETTPMTEDLGVIGDDFSMNICKKWEKAFFKEQLNHTRRVALRTSIVLGKHGGAYPKIKRLTKTFLGGKQGRGGQFVSWIHVLDFCEAIWHVIQHPEVVGPVNIVSPKPVTNSGFMKAFRKSLKVSFGIGQSVWLLELGAKILGTETELLLKSRNVYPERLLEDGFQFHFTDINTCLQNLNS